MAELSEKIKVEAIVPEPQESYEQKIKRIKEESRKRVQKNHPELLEKWEAKQKKKEDLQTELAAGENQRIETRVRKKLEDELFSALGIDENYFTRNLNEISEARKAVGIKDREDMTAKELAESNLDIAWGAKGAVKADIKNRRKLGLDLAAEPLKAALGVAGTAGIASALQSAGVVTAGVATGIASGVTLGFTLLPAALTWILHRVKKAKNEVSLNGNRQDLADKLTVAEESLRDFQKQVETLQKTIDSNIDELSKKYNSMKKEDFNKEVKKVVADALEKAGYDLSAYRAEIEKKAQTRAQGSNSPAEQIQGELGGWKYGCVTNWRYITAWKRRSL